jgi:hypothetical protein
VARIGRAGQGVKVRPLIGVQLERPTNRLDDVATGPDAPALLEPCVPGQTDACALSYFTSYLISSDSRQGRESALVDELERLSALHSTGALTDDEFSMAKRGLLTDLM